MNARVSPPPPKKRQSNERLESDIGRADGLRVPVYDPLLFPYIPSPTTMVTERHQDTGKWLAAQLEPQVARL